MGDGESGLLYLLNEYKSEGKIGSSGSSIISPNSNVSNRFGISSQRNSQSLNTTSSGFQTGSSSVDLMKDLRSSLHDSISHMLSGSVSSVSLLKVFSNYLTCPMELVRHGFFVVMMVMKVGIDIVGKCVYLYVWCNGIKSCVV